MKTILSVYVDVEVATSIRNIAEVNKQKVAAIKLPPIVHGKGGAVVQNAIRAAAEKRRKAIAERDAIPTKISNIIEIALREYVERNSK